MSEPAARTHRFSDTSVTWLNVLVNSSLTAVKFIIGYACASQAMLADAAHSAADLVTDFIVLAGLRVSARPADRSHPYGHRRVNTLAGMFIGAMLLAAAFWIAYQAVDAIHGFLHQHQRPRLEAILPFWVALASVPMKELLFRITRSVGRRTGNVAVVANAWHSRADALVSLGAAAGLLGVVLGGEQWAFLDPLTAVVLSVFLGVTAWKLMAAAADELIDRAPDTKLLAEIEKVVAGTEGVEGFHAFRARQLGGAIEMDIHIQVDPNLSVHDGHEIATLVRRRIQDAHSDVQRVIVHVEPFEP